MTVSISSAWRLDGFRALVTGGSKGIGLAVARELASLGAEVTIVARSQETLDAAVASAAAEGVALLGLAADVATSRGREAILAGVPADRLDILINNAGTNPSAGPLMEVDLGAMDKTWAVNLRAPLLWVRAAYRASMAKHGGSIVNVASVGGLRPSAITGAYNISKAGLVHMTRQLAFELAPEIRVNAVAPAVVKTKLSEMLWIDEDLAARMHPLGRLGTPEDVARAILFLASDAADWMTGVILPVDGGVTEASSSGIA